MIQQRVTKYIEKEHLFSLDAKVLIALSGGADSVALLCILHTAGYHCEAAHCNFHLRGEESDRDELFAQAGAFIIEKDKASIGMLQRAFKIGFNRAARIMDQLAEAGVVGEEEGTKPRKILMSPEQFEEMMEQGY